jgi:hypothetical protein
MIDDLFKRLPTVEEVTDEIYDTASRSRLLRSLRRLLVAIEETRRCDLEKAIQDPRIIMGNDDRLTRFPKCNDALVSGESQGGGQ